MLEVDLILEQELEENWVLQPQHSGNTKLLPSERSFGEFNSLPD